MIRRLPLPLSVPLALGAVLLLVGCGVKNPPEVPQNAGPEWVLPYSGLYGGGYRDESGRVVVDSPPTAYFPGTEDPSRPSGGTLTFPMPNQ